MRCCTPVVVDAKGKELGEVIRYDDRFASIQLNAFVSYRLTGGDTVALAVAPEYILGMQGTGGSTMLFTTPDCSGSTAYAMIYNPPLTKRYGLPTKVVTDCASSEAENRAPDTEMAVPAASLELAVVT